LRVTVFGGWCKNDLVLALSRHFRNRIFSGVDKGMESINKHGRLILGFGVGDSVQVGDCLVTVHLIKGNRVRLMFQAPPEVPITRTNAIRKEPRRDKENG
jgi:sRNA-binding carbon storage regulator CsrA